MPNRVITRETAHTYMHTRMIFPHRVSTAVSLKRRNVMLAAAAAAAENMPGWQLPSCS